jgi:hypothetical protein
MGKREKLGLGLPLLFVSAFIWIVRSIVRFREGVRDATGFFEWVFGTVVLDPLAWGVFALVVILAFACRDDIQAVWRKCHPPKEQIEENVLTPGDAVLSVGGHVGAIPGNAAIFLVGDSVAWTTQSPIKLLTERGETMLGCVIQEGAILLEAKFFNRGGQNLCHVVDNHFAFNNGGYTIDPKPHSLVVYENAMPVVTINFANKRAIRILGDFCMRSGRRVLVEQNAIKIDGHKWMACTYADIPANGTAIAF